MEIDVIGENDLITHIALKGRLDVAGVQEIELRFIALTVSRGKPALIEMSHVDFIASIGLRMFLGSAKALKNRNASLLVYNLRPVVREVFVLAGLDFLIARSDKPDDALNDLTGKTL